MSNNTAKPVKRVNASTLEKKKFALKIQSREQKVKIIKSNRQKPLYMHAIMHIQGIKDNR